MEWRIYADCPHRVDDFIQQDKVSKYYPDPLLPYTQTIQYCELQYLYRQGMLLFQQLKDALQSADSKYLWQASRTLLSDSQPI